MNPKKNVAERSALSRIGLCRVVALILAVLCGSAAAGRRPAVAPEPRAVEVIRLNIGVVPFNDPQTSSSMADDTEQVLHAYFDRLEAISGDHSPARIEVTIVKGNYYQILHWMHDGYLDGVVVSPFSAFLLTHDRDLAVLPVVELVRAGETPAGDTPSPAIVTGTVNGHPLTSPATTLEACLRHASDSLDEPRPTQRCEFRLINHLSTTGFILPLLSIKEFVTRRHLGEKKERAFWTRILQWSRLEMWHGVKLKARPAIPTLRFSYRTPERTGDNLPLSEPLKSLNDVLLIGCKRNAPADVGRDDAARRTALQTADCARPNPFITEFLLPSERDGALNQNNVWIRSGEAIAKLAAKETAARIAEAAKNRKSVARWLGYDKVAAWRENERHEFAVTVTRLFGGKPETNLLDGTNGDTPLGNLFKKWYREREYAFTVDEVVDLLSHDQVIRKSPNAALVLPGGGVRATYQSVILDALYSHSIANAGDPVPGRLLIQSIAGTSGGAMLGYLASHRDSKVSNTLTNNWITNGEVRTKPSDIFPWFGILRWISVLLAIAVFAATAAIHLPSLIGAPARQVPFWYTTFTTITVVASAFLIWRNALRDPSYSPRWEGLSFLIVLLGAHLLHSASLRDLADQKSRRLGLGILMVVLGVLAGVYLASHPIVRSSMWALISAIVALFVIAGLSVALSADGTLLRTSQLKAYGQGMLVLLLLLVLTSFFFYVGWSVGDVTSLEMTVPYWIWVFVAAAFASKIIVTTGKLYPTGPLQDGVEFMTTPSGTVPFPYTPTVTLVVWGTVGVATWLAFIAPALYSSNTARDTFLRIGPADHRPELAPLLVSMTGFGGEIDGYKAYRGDYYACHKCDGIEQRTAATSASLFRLASDRDFEAAVFASGSPFPIFPAAIVPAEPAKRGLFVDGGYAHRVPIEAARLARASQILVVENIARRQGDPVADLHVYRVGALAANLGNAFSYLFDRSQELDVQAQRSAMVGTIYPDWTDPDPFLMDFREPVVKQLRRRALEDLDGHRVGRIVSWGQPSTK